MSGSQRVLRIQSKPFEPDSHVVLLRLAFRLVEEKIVATFLDILHSPSTMVWCWVLGLQLLSLSALYFASTHSVNLCGFCNFVMIFFMNSYDVLIINNDS
tara:strand:+ start:6658 stop:6957 length:300 start_codon:yes stop_codon:yes gene_type:complete